MPKKPAKRPATHADLAAKANAYLKAKSAGRRGYERADRILQEIATEIEPGQAIKMSEAGKVFVLVDKYAGKSIVWTPCAARRWDLDIIEP